MSTLSKKILKTEIADFLAVADEQYLYMLDFADLPNLDRKLSKIAKGLDIKSGSNKIIDNVAEELKIYLSTGLHRFTTKTFLVGTDFQKLVWQKLQNIKFGETKSYSQIAIEIGNEKASRAVATAIGANPLPVIIPCHRAIASDGSLAGYSGGLARKKILLQLES